MVQRGALLLGLVAILVSACTRGTPTASHSPSTTSPSPSAIAWKDCSGGFQCADLPVPLDYSKPTGATISLALIRKQATNHSLRLGSVLLNPGGPGDSGVDFLRGNAGLFTYLNYRFDLVAWDPRGIGGSSPVTCLDDQQLDAYLAMDTVLDDPAEKQAYIQATKNFVAGCEQRSGSLLPFVDTSSSARDMDRIRDAVGDDKMTYLGFSYGTYLGQWYAHLFPTRIRALSLDGVVDSTGASNASQLVGFQQNLDAFLAACKSSSTCAYGQSGDPKTKLNAAMVRLDQAPLAVDSRQLTRGLAIKAVLLALYNQSYWPYLDKALTALDSGDGSLLLNLADTYNERNPDGSYANFMNGGFQATGCIDSSGGGTIDISLFDRVGPIYFKQSPFFGPSEQYQGLACAYWPAHSKEIYERLTIVDGVPPILLVGGTGDPATPYAESQSVTKQIPGSVLLTREGNGHTSYGASLCVRAAEDAYLIQLKVPAAGTVCKG